MPFCPAGVYIHPPRVFFHLSCGDLPHLDHQGVSFIIFRGSFCRYTYMGGWGEKGHNENTRDSYASDLALSFCSFLYSPFPLFRRFGALWDYACIGYALTCSADIVGSLWGSGSLGGPMLPSCHPAVFCFNRVCGGSFCLAGLP